jgi:hypothetical protein
MHACVCEVDADGMREDHASMNAIDMQPTTPMSFCTQALAITARSLPELTWKELAQSRCRCGRSERSPTSRRTRGTGRSPVPVQMRAGMSPAPVQMGERSPGADVAAVSAILVQMWPGRAQSRCRCGSGERNPSTDVAGVSPVPVQMWQR